MKLFEIEDHNKTRIQGDSERRAWFADVWTHYTVDDKPCTSTKDLEAITKLLAAAPMLYSALEGLVTYLEDTTMDWDIKKLSEYRAAKAALAAAK